MSQPVVKHSEHHTAPKHHAHHTSHATADHFQFFQHAASAAQESEQQTGVPASITLAQLALESGYGHAHFGKANNYFGIKAHVKDGKMTDKNTTATGYVDGKTHEQLKSGKVVKITDHFRSYADMQASLVDHGKFLQNNHRYATALANYKASGDSDQFARDLQKAGYATDQHYAEKLISIMNKYHLYQYDVTKPRLP